MVQQLKEKKLAKTQKFNECHRYPKNHFQNNDTDNFEDDFGPIIEGREEKLRHLKKYKYFIILPDENFRIIWDIVMTFLLFYTFFVTPYRIAFEDESLWLIILDQGVDFIFLADIIITFFLAFHNS